jgi:hypothetical protein
LPGFVEADLVWRNIMELLSSMRLVDRIIDVVCCEPQGSLLSNASPDLVMAALAQPQTMDKSVFLVLQRMAEQKEQACAQGRDCVPGFEEERDEIERLMSASPWTLHPDYGCVLRAAVAELDAAARRLAPNI